MPDAHYENPKLAEIYDVTSPWSVDRDFYMSLAGQSPRRILDLGCGTGLLCDAYAARNHDVTGVDPSRAMLDVARRKPHGSKIEWAQSSAQNYRSDRRFDLIIMTGHAFQVLLRDDDVLATFATMRMHLKPDGIVAFESRNPGFDWAREWDRDRVLELPGSIVHWSSRLVALQDDRMTFKQYYRFADQTFVSTSELRFLSRTDIEARLVASGLCVDHVLGDWNTEPFDELSSREIIFIARPIAATPKACRQ